MSNYSFHSLVFLDNQNIDLLQYYCREHFKIFDGNRTSKYDKSGRLQITRQHVVEVPFLSSAEIKVTISLVQQGSWIKAYYLVLGSALYSGKPH